MKSAQHGEYQSHQVSLQQEKNSSREEPILARPRFLASVVEKLFPLVVVRKSEEVPTALT